MSTEETAAEEAAAEEAAAEEAAAEEAAAEEAAAEETSIEELSLPEALLLIALRDEEGRILPSASGGLSPGLAGATLLELVRRGSLHLGDEGWTAERDAAPGDPVLATTLEQIADADEKKGTLHWLRALPNVGDGLRDELIAGLVKRGVLKEEKHHFLWLVSYQLHPAAEASPEDDMRERLRKIVLDEGEDDDSDPTGGLLALLALLEICDLTDEVFSAEERHEHRRRLDRLTEERRVARKLTGAPEAEVEAILVTTSSATAASRTTP